MQWKEGHDMKKMNVGIIGCGNISDIYMKNCTQFQNISVVACADLNETLAKEKAVKYGIPSVLSVQELFAYPEIEMIINLTPPGIHAEICLKALEHGKHVYTEKPLAVSLEDGEKILEAATKKGLAIGAAPDTFLGAGIQTCQSLIEQGKIGDPVAATALMMKSGPEQWHPNPDFFYQPGGGPLFDMGPYYLTTLIQLLGPIKRVAASAKISFHERTIQSGEKQGETITVNTPTHLSGTLDFEKGPIATMVTSFDVWATNTPFIEIYGSEGTISVPDPNTFGGPVLMKKKNQEEWQEVPLLTGYQHNSRGMGVSDMVSAILDGTPQRASGELAFHVLETMHAFQQSSRLGTHIKLESTCKQAPLLDMKHLFWEKTK